MRHVLTRARPLSGLKFCKWTSASTSRPTEVVHSHDGRSVVARSPVEETALIGYNTRWWNCNLTAGAQ